MSRKYVFICDGCDRRQEKNSSGVPTCWADVSVNITGYTNWTSGGGAEKEFTVLLCGSCQITHQSQNDPRTWARSEKAA